MKGDQLGKDFEHADGLRRVQPRRLGIDGAERAEKRAIRQQDRHRNIALQSVSRRRVMAAIRGVLRDIVDHHRLTVLPDLVADRGLDLQFVTRLDRKSTRLNSSHGYISYAVFCLKKKKNEKP